MPSILRRTSKFGENSDQMAVKFVSISSLEVRTEVCALRIK